MSSPLHPHPTAELLPSWFSPSTGVVSSTHAPLPLPSDPFLDLPSHVLSFRHPARTALLDPSTGSSVTYPQLREAVPRIASHLRRVGITPGAVVLIALPNCVSYPAIFLGILSTGAVASPVNPLCSPEELRKIVSGSSAAFAFACDKNASLLRETGLRVFEVPERFDLDAIRIPPLGGPESPLPLIRQSDVAALLYSSGTSGASKGVALTHGNLIAMVELFVRFEALQYAGDPSENVYLCTIPMFHVYGLSLFAVGLLSLGSVVVVMRKFEIQEAVRAIERYKVTHFPVVPPVLTALVRAKGVLGCGLPSLKQVSCGAAPLGENRIEEFVRSYPHVDLIQGYGMTETTAVGARGFNTKSRKYTSVGLLAPNMEAKVVDWHSESCLPPGQKGELWLRGPAIMKGYLNDEDATTSTILDNGWLKTGDIAFFDQDGYLFILDRLKETIKYKGYQIAPADLEAVLISHPEITDASVTGVRDEDAGEIPVAFVVKKSKCVLSSADVIEYVANKVAPHKKVRKVVFVDSIPRSPAGKILRRLLRDYPTSRM